jgi:GxxExxY protein
VSQQVKGRGKSGASLTDQILFKAESYRIIGACFEVYKEKGNGFLEAVYQECLAIELAEQGIPFAEKPRLRLTYKGRLIRHEYVPDFLCFGEIILEIKSVRILTDEHRAQVINYLKATDKQLGLLVNFGHYPKIEHERFVNQPLSRLSRVS